MLLHLSVLVSSIASEGNNVFTSTHATEGSDAIHYRYFINQTDASAPETPLSYGHALNALEDEHDDSFRSLLTTDLKECASQLGGGFYWETPAINKPALFLQPFEFVCTKSSKLGSLKEGNARPFRNQFEAQGCKDDATKAISFPALPPDEELLLIVPCGDSGNPEGGKEHSTTVNYAHIASFAAHGSLAEVQTLLKFLARKMLDRVEEYGATPLWLHTHGTGVSWLHVRIDPKPYKYNYDLFKQMTTKFDTPGTKSLISIEGIAMMMMGLLGLEGHGWF